MNTDEFLQLTEKAAKEALSEGFYHTAEALLKLTQVAEEEILAQKCSRAAQLRDVTQPPFTISLDMIHSTD
ncbi:hypothetical protein [uncultured Litoreibacter sp.]|uniref:hypothetical protein n=1 Tax=uncultured Litoreibacter sp. TaxID=1392394 RepID=UPI002625504D|nr:hypothetical protein [uncultured Litoreibacter sp.]